MASPSLRIPVRADISQFQREMNRTSDIAAKTTLLISKRVISMNAEWLASKGAAGAATLAFGRVLGVLGPIALGITAVRDAFKLMAYATELAKARIEEFNKVTEDANESGFSTDFFQRITKSGDQARDKIDNLTEALKKFNAESTPKLGGSNLQQRLDTLSKAGNFAGNSGVGALAGSNNSEQRLRATVQLIDEAMQKGERLAAIDLAETAFGPKVAAALRADSSYLDDLLKRADAISKTQLISDQDLGRAVELKRRMEDAEKIIADRWKPVQDDLAKLGTNYHANWVSITETLADAVGLATSLYQALGKVPDWFAKRIGGASVWSDLTAATERLGLNSAPADLVTDPKVIAMDGARSKLNAALQNYANVTRSMRETSDVVTAVRGDSSKAPGKVVEAEANAFERAADGVEKYTTRLEADTKAVGLGAAALAEYRTEAALMVAAQQAGIPVTQALRDRIQDLAQDASDAADKLARAKVASEISFGRQTAFVSPEDAQIARQLASIYGDDVPRALQSSEAAALRLNNALVDINRTGQDVTRGLFTDFAQQIRDGATAMDALRSAGVNALSKISDKLLQMAADNLWSSAFGGSSGGVGGFFTSLFGGGGSAPGSIRVGNQSFPAFAGGTNFAPGGLAIVGEQGPELVNLPRGAEVIPNHELPGAMGGTVSAPINISIDARGADREGLARVQNQIAILKAELPARVVTAVRDAKRTRQL